MGNLGYRYCLEQAAEGRKESPTERSFGGRYMKESEWKSINGIVEVDN